MIEYASNRVPLHRLAETGGVLAVITQIIGTSYRDLGTMMAFGPDGQRTGSLSSGCIEDDIAEHAAHALATGQVATLRYGQGSPFFDLKLPCGGGLSVLLIPHPDPAEPVLRRASRSVRSHARQAGDELEIFDAVEVVVEVRLLRQEAERATALDAVD